MSEAGVKAVIDCAAYRGGVRVATLGIDEIPVTVGTDYVPALLRFFKRRTVGAA